VTLKKNTERRKVYGKEHGGAPVVRNRNSRERGKEIITGGKMVKEKTGWQGAVSWVEAADGKGRNTSTSQQKAGTAKKA